jgi:4,5-epoxidase
MTDPDVLVVGAGPAGLTTACALLQHGVSVRVIDRAEGPAVSSRANILHARGVEVLHRLGALGGLRDRAVSVIKMTIHLNGKPVVALRFGEIEGTQLSAMLVSQAEIEAELRRRLLALGGEVEWNTPLMDASEDGAGVTATIGDGEKTRVGWLVGCDGAHSTARRLAGIDFPGVPIADEWLLADVHADWEGYDRTGSSGWLHADGLFFAMPMRESGGLAGDSGNAGDVWRLMADVRLADGETLTEQQILDRLRQLLTERTGLTAVRIRDAKWTSVFRIHRRLADDYRTGRILLAGDAAHIHSPFGGQGMNTGIGDAENLAWKLALVVRSRASEALLDTYQAERRPLATEVLRNTTTNTRVLLADGPLGRLMRDRVLTPITRVPLVQRWATRAASQLWVNYRRGPLGTSAHFARKPRPGDRVPDITCQRTDGTATTLHAELGGHWAVLGTDRIGAARATAEAENALGPNVVTLVATRATTDDVMLVRPDAHLAWRGRVGGSELGHWLESALQLGRSR